MSYPTLGAGSPGRVEVKASDFEISYPGDVHGNTLH